MYWPLLLAQETTTQSLPHCENERQLSVNDFGSCKYGNCIVIWSLLGTTDILAACIGKRNSNMVTAPFRESASTECQQFLTLHLG